MADVQQSSLVVGDRVEHVFSGWAGVVVEIRQDETGMRGSQGPLVTVRPDHPRPVDAPEFWEGWNPITVTAAELEKI